MSRKSDKKEYDQIIDNKQYIEQIQEYRDNMQKKYYDYLHKENLHHTIGDAVSIENAKCIGITNEVTDI